MNARLTAGERRDEVVAAAAMEFAKGGYAGTSTVAIARRAGVSQPYLFQLFGTKQALFLAAVRDCFARTTRRFEEAGQAGRAAGLDSEGLLARMGDAYISLLLADRDLLRLQLHAYAACGDPQVRAVVHEEYFALWRKVAAMAGCEPSVLTGWFGQGMLINVIASVGEARTLEEFRTSLYAAIARA